MQTLESLKRSISSVEDLGSIVRTMKTLAAVSIQQYERAVESLANYAQTVDHGLQMVLWEVQSGRRSFASKAENRTGAIVFGSDQGMCGQFNEQIGTFVLEHRQPDQDWAFMAIGVRIGDLLREAGVSVDSELAVPGSVSGITPLVSDVLSSIDRWRNEQIRRIVVFYNRRTSAASYRSQQEELLPVNPQRFLRTPDNPRSSRTLPTYTMKRDAVLSQLIRHLLFVSLFRACAESLASENASRIASMQTAERNIQQRLSELSAAYHQQRQTSITDELLDVITGFEALSKREK